MPRRATARDVAEMAGVSRTTVSFVLNNLDGMRISEQTRQKVLEAARVLNYHPDASARRLVSGQTQVIGYVESQSPHQAFADAFLQQVLRGLHAVARQNQYHVLFEPSSPDDEQNGYYLQLIRERHVDGIILSGPRSDDKDLLQLHGEGVPVVLQGQLPEADVAFVDVDNVGGARMATEHLIGLGHRRIGLITNAPLVYTAASDRRSGYVTALQEAGLPIDEDLIQAGDFSSASGETAMQALLTVEPRPTAVFVASDTVAIGAMQAAKQAGFHIPADLAFVGFDDVPWAIYQEPALTTIRLPAYGLGWTAGEMLIRLLNGEHMRNNRVWLDTKLIVRKSCGAQ